MTSVQEKIQELGPWFHNLHLPDGTETAPDHFLGDFPTVLWQPLGEALPRDLKGWSVLDVGCNAGFYSFKMAQRGATVTGIDLDPHYLKQAQWAASQYDLEDRVTFRQMQVYDLAHIDEQFDLVLFLGVFYHLRYPLLGLDLVAQKSRRLLAFQSLCMPGEEVCTDLRDRDITNRDIFRDPGWPGMAFIEHTFAKDPTNWWVPNRAAIEALLRSSGLRILSRLHREMYLCEPDLDAPSCVTTWNRAELESATGQGISATVEASDT